MDFHCQLGRCHRNTPKAGVWHKLFHCTRAPDRGTSLSTAVLEVDPKRSDDDFAGHFDVWSNHRLDDLSQRSRVPHAGESSKLADILLHEDLRQGVACLHGVQPDQRSIPRSGATHNCRRGDIPGIASAAILEADRSPPHFLENGALSWRSRVFRKLSEVARRDQIWLLVRGVAGSNEVRLLPTGHGVVYRSRGHCCLVVFLLAAQPQEQSSSASVAYRLRAHCHPRPAKNAPVELSRLL